MEDAREWLRHLRRPPHKPQELFQTPSPRPAQAMALLTTLQPHALRCTRRSASEAYVDAEDILAAAAHGSFPPVFASPLQYWHGMAALWVSPPDQPGPRLYVAEKDARRFLATVLSASIGAGGVEGLQTAVTVSLEVDGVTYFVPTCRPNWKVCDVLLALRAANGAIATHLEDAHELRGTLREARSKAVLDPQSGLQDLAEREWILEATPPLDPLSTCLLRGFPFTYKEEDVLGFLTEHGVPTSDLHGVTLEHHRRKGRFTGYVRVSLASSSCEAFRGRIHGAWAAERYIEVVTILRLETAIKGCLDSAVEKVCLAEFMS